MINSLLLYCALIWLILSPILVWLNLPARGTLNLAISGIKMVVALGWWLLLGTFIYLNFIVGNLNPWDDKLLVFILLFIGCSPALFWLGFPSHSVIAEIVVGSKVVASFIWVIALAIVIYLGFIFSPLDFVQDQIVFQQGSSDGAYMVAVVNRCGGATVRDTTVVVIGSKNSMHDTRHAQVLFEIDGIKKISLDWTGINQLTIHHEDGEVYQQLPTWHNVALRYVNQ